MTRSKKPKKNKVSKERRTKPIYRYEVPDWFKALPATGAHGSCADQKRLWKLVSEYVRERDFKQYGYCAVCKRFFTHWSEGQAGHFKAWSVCKSMFKFDVHNLASICAGCNSFGDDSTGHKFGEEMNHRWGVGHTAWIEQENLRHSNEKMELPLLIAYAEEILKKKNSL